MPACGGNPSSAIRSRRGDEPVSGPAGPEPPVQLTLLPQTGAARNPSSSTLLSAVALGVAVRESTAGRSPATTVPRNTASTSPLTDLNAAFGLSASRRAASKADAPCMNRANARAACAVSQGPPTTRPIRMTIRPGKAGALIEFADVSRRPTMNRTMPASSGTTRHAVGGDGDGGVGEHGLQQGEYPDAEDRAEQRAGHGIDGGDDAYLPGCCPDQSERGVALLAPGGSKARGRADQDQDREQEGDRAG